MRFCTNCARRAGDDETYCAACATLLAPLESLTLEPALVGGSRSPTPPVRSTPVPVFDRPNHVETSTLLGLSTALFAKTAAKTAAVFLGAWLAILVLSAAVGSAIGHTIPFAAKATAGLVLMGFGATASGQANTGYATGSVSVRFAPLIIAVITLTVLYALQRRRRDQTLALGYAAASAVGAALSAVVLSVLAHASGTNVLGLSTLSLSVTWFMPAIVMALCAFLVTSPLSSIPQLQELHLPFSYLRTLTRRLIKIWVFVAACVLLFDVGELAFASGTGANALFGVNLWGNLPAFVGLMLLAVLVFVVVTPNFLPLAFFIVALGVPVNYTLNAGTSGTLSFFVHSSASRLGSLHSENFLLLIVGLALMTGLAVRVFADRRDSMTWAYSAGLFFAVGALLGWLTSITFGATAGVSLLGGGQGSALVGTPVMTDALLFGLAGLLVGLAAHPKVAPLLAPPVDRVVSFFSKIYHSPPLSSFRSFAPIAFIHKLATPRVGASTRQRLLTRLRFWPVAVLALLIVMTVLGKVVISLPGFSSSTTAPLSALNSALESGSAKALDRASFGQFDPAYSSSGVKTSINAVPSQDPGSLSYTLTWPGNAGSAGVAAIVSKSGGMLPKWALWDVTGELPLITPVGNGNFTEDPSFVSINGHKLSTFAPVSVMPGHYTLTATSVDPKDIKAVATFSDKKSAGNVLTATNIIYTNTLTKAGDRAFGAGFTKAFYAFYDQQNANGTPFVHNNDNWKFFTNNDGRSVSATTYVVISSYFGSSRTLLTGIGTFDAQGKVSYQFYLG